MKARSKFSKQILSLVLALVMVFGMLPMTAYAAESDFVFADGIITGYNGTDTELVIPSTIGGVAVTTIGTSAFANNKNITSVVIPDSVTTIGHYAFSGCKSLEKVTYLGTTEVARSTSAFDKNVMVVYVPEGYPTDKKFCGKPVQTENASGAVTSVVLYTKNGTDWQDCDYYTSSAPLRFYGHGNTREFKAEVIPTTAENKNVIWSVESAKYNRKPFINIENIENGILTIDFSQYTTKDFDAVAEMGAYRNDLVVASAENPDITDSVIISVKKYTLKFLDSNGNVLWSIGRPKGVAIEIPEDIKVMEWKDESGNLVTTLPETMPDDGAGETDQAIIYTTDAVYVDYYTVTATANPTEGGSVSGGGEFAEGATVTLIASSNDGYTFVNWTENGIEVSTDAEYAFTVSADRELVANFEAVSTEHKHALNGGEELTWTAITKLSEITGPGNYYIDGTLELDYYDRTINPSGTVNLCLNGASIDYKYAVTVNEGTTLNICDCGGSNITFTIENSGTTNIYSGNFGKRIENYNTLNIYGGSFVTEEYAGSIHNYSGTLTIYDGTIKNNGGHAVENDGGEIIIFDGDFEATKCCVNNDDGTLTIHKGTYISTGSYATIDVDGGSATIKDGTYQNGTSVVVRIYNSGESLIIEDGDFTGNGEVANGTAGVLDIRGGTFTTTGNEKNILIASGTVKVSGGTFTSGNQAWIKRYESGSFQLSGGTFKGGLRLNLDNPSAGGPVLPESLVEGYGYYQNGQHYKFTEGVNKQIITGGDVTVKKSTESYTVTVEETTNGTVEADKATADVGDTVTLTVTPGEGYVLDTLIVKQGENPVEVKTDYSFTMPDGDVIVTATFTSCDHSGSEHETATDNGDGTHDFTCSICRNTEEESHNFDSTTGLCSGCKIQMAVASVTVSANTTYYETLGEAVTAAGVGTESVPATLTLLVDIDLGSSYQRIDSGTFTLDLNGKTLSSSSDSLGIFSESNVTIADSSAAGTGKIIGGDNGLYIENATVTVVGGAIDGYYGVNAKSAIVTINGGTISGKTGVYIDNGEVAITGGTVEGENIGVQATANSEVEISGEAVVKSDRHIESMVSTGVHAADSTVTINGGQISGEKGVYVENSTVTVTGGAVEGEYEGVYAEADSEVKISGGQVGGVDGVYVESSTAIVTGGTFNNNEDCVEAKNSTVTISGGVLTGECGVYVCGSVANITGGTIESTFYGVYADENSEVEIGSDAVVKGGSVLDDYVRAGGFVKGNSVLTVKGGQLGGTFGVYAKGGTINIDGGIIAADYYGAWAKEGSVLNISGGAVTCDAYGVVSYDSTVAVSGANISGNYGLYVEGGDVTLSGGSISGTYNDIVHYENTVKLILPEGKTQGTTFPDGISVYGTPLVELLGEGAAYWQGNKQISPTTKQLEIADGTVTIQAPCNHSGNTNDDYIDNGDGTHSLSCTVCDKLAVTGEHTGGEATCVDKAVCGTCGASYGETASNAHDLIYTTSDRTITVSCGHGCGYEGTATISATGKTYDGKPVQAEVKTTGVLENETITIVYCCQDGCVKVGEHTASITLGGKTVSVSFTISKADSVEPNDPGDKDIPDTGDHSNLWLWIVLLVISSAGIFASIVYARKRRTESK